jgi:quercetin dioxygenase-like cupin family protein
MEKSESMSTGAVIIHVNDVDIIQRGGGIETVPLITPLALTGAKFTTGMSVYPKGMGAPLHRHNCEEQVTLLEGEGEVEVDGVVTPLMRYDSTYIQANKIHAFRNTGDQPMRILWIYASNKVTRTFAGSDEEVEHLSKKDLMSQQGR